MDFSTTAKAIITIDNGFVKAISLTDFGGEYFDPPTVTIIDPEGTGSGAMATAIVEDGEVTEITIENEGNNYSPSTTVSIEPPPPKILHQTYWSHDGSSANGSEPASSISLTVVDGLFSVQLGAADAEFENMTKPIPSASF